MKVVISINERDNILSCDLYFTQHFIKNNMKMNRLILGKCCNERYLSFLLCLMKVLVDIGSEVQICRTVK